MLEKRQALGEKKFRLKYEESRLKFEAEIAKKSAKERALAAMTTLFLLQQQPVKLEPEFNDQDSAVPFRVSKTIQEEYPHLEQGDPCNFILRGPHNLFVPTATKDLRRETIELQRKQTTL